MSTRAHSTGSDLRQNANQNQAYSSRKSVRETGTNLRDRGAGETGDRICFTSALLPRWARRTKNLGILLPILYLRGVSTGDFQEALGALLGKDAPNLSPSVIGRLKEEWVAGYARWQKRNLSRRRSVYVWADGV